MPSILHPRLLERRILPLLLAINLLLLLYYITVDYSLAVHSDAAVMNTLAQEIHDTGQFFPRGWYYANGDLWLWFTQLPIVPLLSFFPNSYALHAVSSVITAALVLLGAWCVGLLLGQSLRARLLVQVVLAAGISVNMAENLYGQAAYGVLFYFACFLAYSAWRTMQADGARRWRWGALFALLTLLVFWSNPQRAVVFYALPLVIATWALAAVPRTDIAPLRRAQRQRAMLLVGLMALAALPGILLHGHYVRLVGNSGLPPATWLGFDAMGHNVAGALQGMLSLLGGLPPPGTLVINGAGVWAALHLLAALALLALMPWALRTALRAPWRRGRLFFAVFTLTSACVNLFVVLATSVADMSAPEQSLRYMVPALLCALILLAGMAVDDVQWRRPAHVAALLAFAVLGIGGSAYRVDHGPAYFPHGGVRAYNGHAQLADFAQAQGLRYGYAGFWNAGTMTLDSAGRVKLRQIAIDHGLPVPMRHLASERWYQPEAWQGETFLMFNDADAKAIDWPRMARYLGQPVRTLDFGGNHFYVYPDNIAAHLPLWDYRHPVALPFPVNAATPHQIGRLIDGDSALQADAGQAGYLQSGPYRFTLPGHYQVRFALEADGNAAGADFGTVDVAANGGATILAKQAIVRTGVQSLALEVTLTAVAADLEFRVQSSGAGRLIVRGVDLLPLDPRAAYAPR